MLLRQAWPGAESRQCPRRHVDGLLVTDHRGQHQIRHFRPSRRQQGRGRDLLAARHARCGPARRQPKVDHPHPPHRLRGIAAIRRRRHHPGHLRALSHRRVEHGHRRRQPLRSADHLRHPGIAVPRSAARYSGDRQDLRSGDDRLVFHHRFTWTQGNPGPAGHPRRHQPPLRHHVLRHQPSARHRCPGLGGPLHHRLRGPLCRHGPFRPLARSG